MITAVAGSMRQRGWSRIINITSGAVKEPIPLLGLSTAARLGLTGFVASIAREIAPDGVTVNNLLPGPFDTDRLASYFAAVARTKGISESEARQAFLAGVPAGRAGFPEEFGAACAFLASGRAGFTTGQNIVIDGGAHYGAL
jgi:3-oxoacyl-[acyl-carrier protein] reductase